MLQNTINDQAIFEIEEYCKDHEVGSFNQEDTCVFFQEGEVILCITGWIGENKVEFDLTIIWENNLWTVTELKCTY